MISLNKHTFQIVHTILTTLISTMILSFLLTALKNTEGSFPWMIWIQTWSLVFLVALILSTFLPKITRNILNKIFLNNN